LLNLSTVAAPKLFDAHKMLTGLSALTWSLGVARGQFASAGRHGRSCSMLGPIPRRAGVGSSRRAAIAPGRRPRRRCASCRRRSASTSTSGSRSYSPGCCVRRAGTATARRLHTSLTATDVRAGGCRALSYREMPRRLRRVPTFCRRTGGPWRLTECHVAQRAYHLVAGLAVFLQRRCRGFDSLRVHPAHRVASSPAGL
jgi:hypothetical protein